MKDFSVSIHHEGLRLYESGNGLTPAIAYTAALEKLTAEMVRMLTQHPLPAPKPVEPKKEELEF